LVDECREPVEPTVGVIKEPWRDAACGFWRGGTAALLSLPLPVRTPTGRCNGRARREKVVGESGKIAAEVLRLAIPGALLRRLSNHTVLRTSAGPYKPFARD
jgi:hypothetical protein